MTAAPSRRPEIRVVCVTYHPGAELAEFAESLQEATTRPVELVLVENGDDPTVVNEVGERHGARVLLSGANLGYGSAANLGAAGATAPWLVVANPDLRWHPGSLDTLLAATARHPEAGAFGPRVLSSDGTVYPSARALPSLTTGIGHALLVRVWPGNPWTRAYQADLADRDDEHRAGWLSGSCLLLRRAAFEAVGGFDEAYFMFFEDVDLGDRLARAGWASVHVPGAVVTHEQGTSWRHRPEPMIRAHHDSAARYLSGRYGEWYQWPVRTALRIGLRIRLAAEVRAARRG
ncbi:glycosyltransferase family 2 protein [Actinotalea sp. M2MS4P-6]|uniref:glycosyltransferase family 2 protein n=1 Tax=Actinotalea sp. M2MS4P-6 TaxID=2983762 RepID=UPI0021E35E40|nr:glycosyltransferase family 2 protein [Actinotalea sp. M2MS4P-6]MCV2394166.1 glycosyltransferase family 2 protein [Actinotalea sp. M2MS4P-6]